MARKATGQVVDPKAGRGWALRFRAYGKRRYVTRGLAVGKSYGRKYVEFDTPSSPVTLALYGRRALAKDAGVPPEGTGSHRLVLGGGTDSSVDPDGFAWEAAPHAARSRR